MKNLSKIVSLLFVVALIGITSSCESVRSTNSVLSSNNLLQTTTTAELSVSTQKITYVYTPSVYEKWLKPEAMKGNAIAAALKANGNADVLVAPQFVFKEKDYYAVKEYLEITVTGYPATYKKFKNVENAPLRVAVPDVVKKSFFQKLFNK